VTSSSETKIRMKSIAEDISPPARKEAIVGKSSLRAVKRDSPWIAFLRTFTEQPDLKSFHSTFRIESYVFVFLL
jgi:hypothetical protein